MPTAPLSARTRPLLATSMTNLARVMEDLNRAAVEIEGLPEDHPNLATCFRILSKDAAMMRRRLRKLDEEIVIASTTGEGR